MSVNQSDDHETSVNGHGFMLCSCVVEINECSPNPCKNGGNCTDMVNGFSCSCVAGYTGKYCSSGMYHSVPNTLHTFIHCIFLQMRVVVRWE